MTRFTLLFAALLIPNVILAGPKTLEDYRNIYVAERVKIGARYSGKTAAGEAYMKALAQAKAAATKKADLDTAMAVVAEQKRFKDLGDLTTEAPAEQSEAIKKAQAEYNAIIAKSEQYKNAKTLALSKNYIAGLKGLMTKHMKAENFAAAKPISEEIKMVEATLASLQSELPVTPKPARPVASVQNIAGRANVTVSSTQPGNGHPSKLTDGMTNDASQHASWWYAGDQHAVRPYRIGLNFASKATLHRLRILVPSGTKRFPNGHELLDYEVSTKEGVRKHYLARVKNGRHPKTVVGPISSTRWIVIEPKIPVSADSISIECSRTSGMNVGPVVFEVEVIGSIE